MTVSTNSLTMTRIVRTTGLGFWAQRWSRTPGTNTAWHCDEERRAYTLRSAMRRVLPWPGPLVIEEHGTRERSAVRPPR